MANNNLFNWMRRSGLAWLQLKTLGYKDVRIYNGGWGD